MELFVNMVTNFQSLFLHNIPSQMFGRVLNKPLNITLIRIIQRKILAEQKEIGNLQKKIRKKRPLTEKRKLKPL